MLCIIEAFFIVLALSTDAFVASVSYGTQGIKIPYRSGLVIAGISALMLAASSLLGGLLSPFLPPFAAKLIGFCVLVLLGVTKLFDSFIKSLIKRLKRQNGKNLKFTLFNITFLLDVYADCKKADKDSSSELSIGESIALSVALSLDSLAAGFGVGVSSFFAVIGGAMAFLLTLVAVYVGFSVGKRLLSKIPFDLSFLGGIMLIILAFFRL